MISSSRPPPGASPASTAPSCVTSRSRDEPASTAWASSPPWLACSQSSQKSCVARELGRRDLGLARAVGAHQAHVLPGRSAPSRSSTSCPGVTVTTQVGRERLLERGRDRRAELVGDAARARRRRRPRSRPLGPRARNVRAAARPFTPAPITAAVCRVGAAERLGGEHRRRARAQRRHRARVEHRLAAARLGVESSTSPLTVGSPRAGLPGNDVTHFSSACPPPSAGIARKSPAG